MSVNNNLLLPVFRSGCALAALLVGAVCHACHASTVISEVFYDAAGADSGRVFVELFGPPGTLLDGIILEGVNGLDGAVYKSIALAGAIPFDGLYVIADDLGDGSSHVENADLVADVDFQNGPDSIVLRTVSAVLDALGYGDFSTAVFAGEGHAAADAPAGYSLARIDPRHDSDDNRMDFSLQGEPSPGAVTAVPLPASIVLLVSGVAGIAGIGRRRRTLSG